MKRRCRAPAVSWPCGRCSCEQHGQDSLGVALACLGSVLARRETACRAANRARPCPNARRWQRRDGAGPRGRDTVARRWPGSSAGSGAAPRRVSGRVSRADQLASPLVWRLGEMSEPIVRSAEPASPDLMADAASAAPVAAPAPAAAEPAAGDVTPTGVNPYTGQPWVSWNELRSGRYVTIDGGCTEVRNNDGTPARSRTTDASAQPVHGRIEDGSEVKLKNITRDKKIKVAGSCVKENETFAWVPWRFIAAVTDSVVAYSATSRAGADSADGTRRSRRQRRPCKQRSELQSKRQRACPSSSVGSAGGSSDRAATTADRQRESSERQSESSPKPPGSRRHRRPCKQRSEWQGERQRAGPSSSVGRSVGSNDRVATTAD
eukprot:COSAG02_NODE_14192_length_1299_cov_0.851667_1_plen_377_part_01